MKFTNIRCILFVLTTSPGHLVLALRDRHIQEKDDEEKWDALFLEKTTADRRTGQHRGSSTSRTNVKEQFIGHKNKLHHPVVRTSVTSLLDGKLGGIKDGAAVDEGALLKGAHGEDIPEESSLVRKATRFKQMQSLSSFCLHIMKSNSRIFLI
jgi:hypothetical protein